MSPFLPQDHGVLPEFTTADIIAICVLLGGMLIYFFNPDPIIGGILLTTVGYYFGKQVRPVTKE